MKFNFYIAIFCALTMVFGGCSVRQGGNENQEAEYSAQISSLEQKISSLEQNYSLLDKSGAKELEALRAEIETLKGNEPSGTSATTGDAKKIFSYDIDGQGEAVVTGYGGDDTYLAIPRRIDSYDVVKIGKRAFESSKLTCVIISEGVQSIDWFAFYNSPFLTSVTIPASVTSIGYSAFEGCSSSLTIYCARNSYAHSYAQSYGISYVII